jgi:hypothetical protein
MAMAKPMEPQIVPMDLPMAIIVRASIVIGGSSD